MKITLIAFLLAVGSINSSAQSNAVNVYTIYAFEDYDFVGFGGAREFEKSIYRRILYPAIEREQGKEGSVRAVLRYNGDGTYDIYTFTAQPATWVTFHQEVESVLREVIELSTNGREEKMIVEMLFTFNIDRDYKRKNRDCTTGQFCIMTTPILSPKRSVR